MAFILPKNFINLMILKGIPMSDSKDPIIAAAERAFYSQRSYRSSEKDSFINGYSKAMKCRDISKLVDARPRAIDVDFLVNATDDEILSFIANHDGETFLFLFEVGDVKTVRDCSHYRSDPRFHSNYVVMPLFIPASSGRDAIFVAIGDYMASAIGGPVRCKYSYIGRNVEAVEKAVESHIGVSE